MLNKFYHGYAAIVFRTVLFDALWRLCKLLFFEENLVIFMFLFYRETSNFHNSEIIGRRKLPNPSMNIPYSDKFWRRENLGQLAQNGKNRQIKSTLNLVFFSLHQIKSVPNLIIFSLRKLNPWRKKFFSNKNRNLLSHC